MAFGVFSLLDAFTVLELGEYADAFCTAPPTPAQNAGPTRPSSSPHLTLNKGFRKPAYG